MVSHNFRNVLLNLVKSIALIQIQCIVHMKDQIKLKNSTRKAKQKKRSLHTNVGWKKEKNARVENRKQMNTEVFRNFHE